MLADTVGMAADLRDRKMLAAIRRADPGPASAKGLKITGHLGAVATFRRLVAPSLLRHLPKIKSTKILGATYASSAQRTSATSAHIRLGVTVQGPTPTPIVVHELGHVAEFAADDLFREAAAFLRRRAGRVLGKRVDQVQTLEGAVDYVTGMGRWDVYSADKVEKRAEFLDRYAGRIYLSDVVRSLDTGGGHVQATEVISIGLQRMAESPTAFAERDWEYFEFILRRVIWRD